MKSWTFGESSNGFADHSLPADIDYNPLSGRIATGGCKERPVRKARKLKTFPRISPRIDPFLLDGTKEFSLPEAPKWITDCFIHLGFISRFSGFGMNERAANRMSGRFKGLRQFHSYYSPFGVSGRYELQDAITIQFSRLWFFSFSSLVSVLYGPFNSVSFSRGNIPGIRA